MFEFVSDSQAQVKAALCASDVIRRSELELTKTRMAGPPQSATFKHECAGTDTQIHISNYSNRIFVSISQTGTLGSVTFARYAMLLHLHLLRRIEVVSIAMRSVTCARFRR